MQFDRMKLCMVFLLAALVGSEAFSGESSAVKANDVQDELLPLNFNPNAQCIGVANVPPTYFRDPKHCS